MISDLNLEYDSNEFSILRKILLETIERSKNKVDSTLFAANLASDLKNITDENEFSSRAANIFLLSVKERELALRSSNTEILEQIIEKIQEKLTYALLSD